MLPSIITTQNASRTANLPFGSAAHVVTERKPTTPQFGLSAAPSPKSGTVDKLFEKISKTRTTEMLWEDFVGFGALRTIMDSMRGFFFGTGGINAPAAAERLGREGLSIFTDNILSGVSAAGIGKVADKRLGSYSNKWTNFPTLELFQNIVREQTGQDSSSIAASEQRFLERLAQKMSGNQPNQQTACLDTLKTYWNNPTANRAELAAKLAKQMKLQSFDIKMGSQVFKLDELLEDVGLFKEQMTRLNSNTGKVFNWQSLADKTLSNTLKVKNWKMSALGLGMAATFAVPSIIALFTEKVFKIGYYPGEMGLKPGTQKTAEPQFAAQTPIFNQFTATSPRKEQPQKPASKTEDNRFQYVKESMKKGHFGPLLLALSPLPFAAGLFDTERWKFIKPFTKVWRNSLDFSKKAPFTTQQQMAATFALLITSRLLTSRSDNEFRERMVDSGLGWILWILGTPIIKRVVAGAMDQQRGSALLLKEVPINDDGSKTRRMLRTSDEVAQLSKYMKNVTPEMVEKAQLQLKRISRGSLLTSVILLGIVEPYLAIQWTKSNSLKKQAQQEQLQAQQARPNNLQFANTPQPFTAVS